MVSSWWKFGIALLCTIGFAIGFAIYASKGDTGDEKTKLQRRLQDAGQGLIQLSLEEEVQIKRQIEKIDKAEADNKAPMYTFVTFMCISLLAAGYYFFQMVGKDEKETPDATATATQFYYF